MGFAHRDFEDFDGFGEFLAYLAWGGDFVNFEVTKWENWKGWCTDFQNTGLKLKHVRWRCLGAYNMIMKEKI